MLSAKWRPFCLGLNVLMYTNAMHKLYMTSTVNRHIRNNNAHSVSSFQLNCNLYPLLNILSTARTVNIYHVYHLFNYTVKQMTVFTIHPKNHAQHWNASMCIVASVPLNTLRSGNSSSNYHKTSSISHTKSQNSNVSCILLQLSLLNPLKQGVKLRMEMQLEQRRQAMPQLDLSYQQFHCLLRCDYIRGFTVKLPLSSPIMITSETLGQS